MSPLLNRQRRSYAFNICRSFWVFEDCFPQVCFKLYNSSLINLSPRAAFLVWFSLVSLNYHQPVHIFPAVWQCWSLGHLPLLLLFMCPSATLVLPQNPSSAGMAIAPLFRCLLVQLGSSCPPPNCLFIFMPQTRCTKGVLNDVSPAADLQPPPGWCHHHI